jgi:hypothetical protein
MVGFVSTPAQDANTKTRSRSCSSATYIIGVVRGPGLGADGGQQQQRRGTEAGDPATARAELGDVGPVSREHRFAIHRCPPLRVGDPPYDRPERLQARIASVGAVLARGSTVRAGRLDRCGGLGRLSYAWGRGSSDETDVEGAHAKRLHEGTE